MRDLSSLVDRQLLAVADRNLSAAAADLDVAAEAVRAAELDLEKARSAPEKLLRSALGNETVSSADIIAATRAESDANLVLAFRQAVLEKRQREYRQEVQHRASAACKAHLPVVRAAAEQQILAAEIQDKALWDAATSALVGTVRTACTLLNTISLPQWGALNLPQLRLFWNEIGARIGVHDLLDGART